LAAKQAALIASIKDGTTISVSNLQWLTKQLRTKVVRQYGKGKPRQEDYVRVIKILLLSIGGLLIA